MCRWVYLLRGLGVGEGRRVQGGGCLVFAVG